MRMAACGYGNVERGHSNGSVYDLVNQKGELYDRVQLPGAWVVGFAREVVYLSSREGAGVSFVRARIR